MKILDTMIPPTVWNAAFIGICAVLFIAFGKWLTQKYAIPGLTELFAAA